MWKSGPYAAVALSAVRAADFVTSDAPGETSRLPGQADATQRRCNTDGMDTVLHRLFAHRSLEFGVGLLALAVVLALAITFGGDPDDVWSPLHVGLVAVVALAGLGLCGWSRIGASRPAGDRD